MSNAPVMPVLTLKEIKERAPQVFTDHAFDRTSGRYSFLPTFQIVKDMEKLGWKVSHAVTMATSDPVQQKYGKHMLKFFNPDLVITNKNGVEAYPQIIIMNNHRGWGKFRFEIGIFRLACSNGLVTKERDMGGFTLRHLGYSFEELQRLVNQAIEELPQVVRRINQFSKRIMSPSEQLSFAKQAIRLRVGEERQLSDADARQVLQSVRKEDEGSSTWVVFNRVQEYIINGGFELTTEDNKVRKVRKITNMLKDLELNEQLWELAEQFA
jgi:hypothetical protein